MALAFVLDEHLRGPLWHSILRHNLIGDYTLDVVRAGDAADLPLGARDSEVLLWAERQSRLLITEDRHTMASHLHRHLAGGHRSPGILIARFGIGMRQLLECLILVAHAGQPSDFADSITYIP